MCPDEVGIKFWFPAFGLAIFVRVASCKCKLSVLHATYYAKYRPLRGVDDDEPSTLYANSCEQLAYKLTQHNGCKYILRNKKSSGQ